MKIKGERMTLVEKTGKHYPREGMKVNINGENYVDSLDFSWDVMTMTLCLWSSSPKLITPI